jgi:arylsulfatase A-like enzyme
MKTHFNFFNLLLLLSIGFAFRVQGDEARRPNVVIIFTDDQGYADLSCQGASGYKTPNIDALARSGVRLTNFHVAQPVCSASRAALLTGCYPNRIGIHGALGPRAKIGLNPSEVTIARMLKDHGYRTAHFGKWHLGDAPEFLPPAHGFDVSLGIPYSGDMWPYHPEARPGTYPPLPLVENGKVIEGELDAAAQETLTTRYAREAVKFIRENQAQPFFLYVAPNQPHVPLFVSSERRGKSGAGLYGDVIEEVDWAVGEILSELRRCRLENDTLVVFSSDNGPWLSYGEHAGSAGVLREGKGTVYEGGVRVPCIFSWPGKLSTNRVSDEFLMTIDVLPTIAALTGAKAPNSIDGRNVWPLIEGRSGAKNPHEAYYFYYMQNQLQAVVSWPWKLMFPHQSRSMGTQPKAQGGKPGKYEVVKILEPELYDLSKDISETRNLFSSVQANNPSLLEKLNRCANEARERMGDALQNRMAGSETRQPGQRAQ